MRIYLVGFMGAGKSTVGRCLAARLQWQFSDLDREIERRAGMDVPSLFERHGEARFRELESKALESVGQWPRLVVATGGGTFAREENVDLIRRRGVSVWLDPPFDLLIERIERWPGRRPMFQDRQGAQQLWLERREWYGKADLHIATGTQDESALLVERIIELIKERPCVT